MFQCSCAIVALDFLVGRFREPDIRPKRRDQNIPKETFSTQPVESISVRHMTNWPQINNRTGKDPSTHFEMTCTFSAGEKWNCLLVFQRKLPAHCYPLIVANKFVWRPSQGVSHRRPVLAGQRAGMNWPRKGDQPSDLAVPMMGTHQTHIKMILCDPELDSARLHLHRFRSDHVLP